MPRVKFGGRFGDQQADQPSPILDATRFGSNQFGVLTRQYTKLEPASPALRVLVKVSITVRSNIHLNSFMYEPRLDLTNDHLIRLYREVKDLVA